MSFWCSIEELRAKRSLCVFLSNLSCGVALVMSSTDIFHAFTMQRFPSFWDHASLGTMPANRSLWLGRVAIWSVPEVPIGDLSLPSRQPKKLGEGRREKSLDARRQVSSAVDDMMLETETDAGGTPAAEEQVAACGGMVTTAKAGQGTLTTPCWYWCSQALSEGLLRACVYELCLMSLFVA